MLLLQGQLVSTFGDAIYTIALSFFVLKLTGSTTFVGTIMGLVTIPRILLGPFAGAIIDRHNKKTFIVLPDLIRGFTICMVSFMEYKDWLTVWMLTLIAVIDGICAAFFNPTMETAIPEIVNEERLVQANSIFNMLTTGVDVLGQTVGGALYNILGAPVIFLINGISYLFSAGTETFISLPRREEKETPNTIIDDMKTGIRYIFNERGLLIITVLSFFLNFLFGIIRVLIIPWFMNTDGFGITKYGFFNGACSAGMIAGMLILSVINIKDKVKYAIYSCSVLGFILLVDLAAFINHFYAVMVCFVCAFMFQIVFNTLMSTTILVNTKETMRGKVSATRITLCMAASPVGNFAGGVIGDCMKANMAIAICATISLVVSCIFLNNRALKDYFNNFHIKSS